jgi:peptide deformylase
MSILKVSRLGHPVLRMQTRQLAKDVLASPAIQTLIDNMMETMVEYYGVGLAANQVHESLAIAVIESHGPRGAIPMTVLVNPEVTILDEQMVEDWEGCLSIPDLRGRVPRYRKLRVNALDRHVKTDAPAQRLSRRIRVRTRSPARRSNGIRSPQSSA